jgi:GAF domain-containing protein
VDNAIELIVNYLHDKFEKYSWVGIYLIEGNELVLGPWKGSHATEHVRIPIGKGVCGAAAASGVTEIVGDVSTDPRYLACFVSTKSEIVVPIKKDEVVVGEIDIDSDKQNAFDYNDADFLERVAKLLSIVV